MKLKRGGFAAIGVGALVAVAVVGGSRYAEHRERTTGRAAESSSKAPMDGSSSPPSAISSEATQVPGGVVSGNPAPAGSGQQQTQALSSAGSSNAAGGTGGGLSGLAPQLTSRIDEYSKLKRQVLPKDDSEAAKSRLMHDEQLLASLKPVFGAAPATAQEIGWQNAAIDYLFDARAQAASEAALGVLRSIVEDPSVEKNEVTVDARAALAGVKAEVMYRWVALEPSRADEIQRLLPGPISRKIWDNVIAAQKQNRLESVALSGLSE